MPAKCGDSPMAASSRVSQAVPPTHSRFSSYSKASLRRLEALLCVADEESSFVISGNGDVIEPEHDLMAIGSGGPYAQAAALALLRNTELGAREIVETALGIAGEICVFTNQNITIEEL